MAAKSSSPCDPQTHRDLVEQGWKERKLPGFAGLIGPFWTRPMEAGWAYGILVGVEHTNPAGIVHGGLLMSLMDHAMSSVAWEHVERIPCVTVQMETRFLSSAKASQFIIATAIVEKATSSLIFTRGVITAGGNDIVSASSVLKVLRASPDRSSG